MDEFQEKDKPEQKIAEMQTESFPMPEPIRVVETAAFQKQQHADDVALTQCILCVILVLCVFSLHWLKPEWQELLLAQYMEKREAAPILWLDGFLQAIQQWLMQ